jgi:diadenosine tetraphosphate (Ap4A) HIT family hydrolase
MLARGRGEGGSLPTAFTRIIEGELPDYIVWEDERCVAFLCKLPFRPGHSLVVSRVEVDQWLDLDPGLISHLTEVAQQIGQALRTGFRAARVAVFIAGVEIPHAHVHLIPVEPEVHRIGFDFMDEAEFRRREDVEGDATASSPDYEGTAKIIRKALKELGFGR